MINNNAIKLLNYSLSNNSSFLDDASFATNAAVYSFLKNEFRKGDIRSNPLFKWAFTSFYGMGIVPSEGKEAFFSKMESLKNCDNGLDARQLTQGLKPEMGKNYFSFVTKMLNLVDDNKFPIYDSQIALIFQKPFSPAETRLDHQSSIYRDVIDTYCSIESHPVIERFRNLYGCPGMGYMKVLDALFWKLGGIMDQNYEMFPWE